MIGLLQRVSTAAVVAGGKTVAQTGRGLLVLVGVERNDQEAQADRLLERLLGYRVFPDHQGRMNLSLRDIGVHGQVAAPVVLNPAVLVDVQGVDLSGGQRAPVNGKFIQAAAERIPRFGIRPQVAHVGRR